MRPGWASSEPRGRWCAPGRPGSPGRHPPPSSGRPLFSRLLPPTGGSANDEASSRIHLRSPVRPSPACGPPGGTGALGPFPGLRTLQLPAAHAGAGTVLTHWTGSYVTDISRSPFDERHSSHATSCRTAWSSQEQLVGVKCRVIRWFSGRASHRRISGGLLRAVVVQHHVQSYPGVASGNLLPHAHSFLLPL